MPEPVNLVKTFDIRPTALVKSTSSTVKGILVILAIAGLAYGVYKAYIKKPEPTQTQKTNIIKPETVQIDQRQIITGNDTDVMFLGLRIWRLKFGVSYLQEKKQVKDAKTEIKGK